jgi:hypothetical protein
MGSASAKSFRRVEAILDRSNNTNPTFARGSITLVCGSFALFSECGTCTREDRWPAQKTGSSILRLRSLKFIKEKLYRIGEGVVCCINGSRKLRHYFQAYHIIVPSSQPLKDIMRNREATGMIGKWAAELNEFSIDYVHRSSIQS